MQARWLGIVVGCLALVGCTGLTGSPPQQAAFVPTPGQYEPGPQSNPRLTLGVPPVATIGASGVATADLPTVAAGQLLSLLDASGRFDLIDPVALRQRVQQAGEPDAIEPGRLVHTIRLPGVRYLMLGQIHDLSVRKDPEPDQISVAGVEKMLKLGPGYKPKLVADAKVDLWVVNPGNGEVEVSGHGDFHRVATPEEFGLAIGSADILGKTDVTLNAEDTRRMVRLMLDDALRQMLPRYDRWASQPVLQLASGPAEMPTTRATTAPAATSPAALQFCPNCGAKVSATDEFCPNCGRKLR